jgi:acyl-coenzyme A synthetase/AMP-(fatty) acid ligase/acetyltransferase-like isoleucine patch superfamily enzyme/acyl carrier protein
MVKLLVKVLLQFFFWKPKNWRKGLKANIESRLYSIAIRRRAKKCGGNLYILGAGVNVTGNTTIGDGVGFGKNVKIRGDGPVFIGRRAAIAEDVMIYTQVHDYDHSNVLPFGWGFTYPETRIDDYAWIGLRSIILPGAHIGEGAVVQAGSVVMGRIPPCAIAAGNPAKVIGYRDVEHYNRLKVASGGKPVEIPVGKGNGERGMGNDERRRVKGERGKVNDLSAKAGERLDDVFCSVFSVTPEEAHAMSYKNHPAWDSAGQMALVAALEREFGVQVSPEDIYRLRSYDDALALVGGHQPPTANFQPPSPGNQLPTSGFFDLERDGIAVIYDGREITFRELKAMGEKAIVGSQPRSVRFIKATTSPETIALFAACINNGIVPLMLPEKIDQALYDKLHALYADASVHDDLAFLISTSGSTGSPKLVRTSYANFRADNMYAAADHRLAAGDRFLIPLPLCYAFGIQVMGACLSTGTTIVITSKSVMDAGFGDVMANAKATHFVGVPYMYEMLDRLGFFARPFPSLRNLSISGGALGPALRRKYAEWARDTGRIFCEIYGQTETLAYMAKLETNDHLDRIGSIGQASSGGHFTVKENGELVYHGPIVAMGYATCAEDLLKGDEWKGVRETGDVATIDAEGYVTLTGRASRFVKIFGNRVSLQEVENILKDAFPAASIAATGADNDLHVFATHVSAEEVERLLVAKLHFNSTVMKVHLLDEMPLNANGKTDYQRLGKAAASPQCILNRESSL